MANGEPTALIHTPAWDEAVSAYADGEATGYDPGLIASHLAGCERCRSLVAVGPADPGLASRVAARVADDDRSRVHVVVRAALGAIGLALIAAAIPDLAAGHDDGMSVHAARHLGSFTAAYGVALLVVAVRPARARTVLPVSVVLAGALVITALIDVLDGHVPLVGEAWHLPELASVVLVWLLTRRTRSRRSVP